MALPAAVDTTLSSARSPDRARIETSAANATSTTTPVAPGHQTGRGLKQVRCDGNTVEFTVAPGHQTGRGLKLQSGISSVGQSSSSARSPDRARIETVIL